MIDEIVGIIIKEKPYGETSKIIDIASTKYGIISCLCKGARTMKSAIRSVSTKLTYGKFDVYYKKDKLSILSGCDVIDNFKNILKNIDSISYATYLLELTEQVLKQTNDLEIVDILIAGLIKIDQKFDPLIITNIIELKYLDYLGVMPVIDSCSVCGKKTGITTLSSYKGG